jgi:fibro-slime domain-containing protein
MRFIPPARLALISCLLVTGACASGKIIGSGPEGNGGSRSDASVVINFDAISISVNLDARSPNRVGSDAPPGPNCGNGELTQDEACDDGNRLDSDGCAANCLSVEQGWSCVSAGKPCRQVARCGDGLVVFPEQCDDGNKVNGDGCSDGCRIELTWKCDGNPSRCSHTTCGDNKVEGAEACEDGNGMPFDGCSAECQNEPVCKGTSGCTSRCGDGIKFSNEDCDDGNNTDGDGCSSDCKVEKGFKCEQPSIGDSMQVPAIYRDFKYHNPTDFEAGVTGSETATLGLVKADLDSNGKPVYTGVTGGAVHIESAASFAKWYTNVDGVNHATTGHLTLWNNGKGAYVNRYKEDGTQWYNTEPAYYCGNVGSERTDDNGDPIPCTSKYATATNCDELAAKGEEMLEGSCISTNGSYSARYIVERMDDNPLFFPVDDDKFSPASELHYAQVPPLYDPAKTWPHDVDDSGKDILHNFSFTSEVRYWFKFDKSKTYTLEFIGDDDVWVFINRKLAVDLGGIHSPVNGSVTLDAATAAKFGLSDGNVYEIAVFQAERQTTSSSYKLTLSGFNAAPSICKPDCGDGVLEIGEECDNGKDNGTGGYGSCDNDCTLKSGFCGDGEIQPGEDCDDGGLNGTEDHCPSGCRILIIL